MRDVNILKNNDIDVDKSLELFGDMGTYDEMLQTFLNEITKKMSNIAKYKEVADMANYAVLVHSLKSDSRYFGFTKLGNLAEQHEFESKANHIYFVYNNYDELVKEANRVISVVRKYFGQSNVEKPTEEVIIKDKTILVVDDSDVMSSFIKKIFDETYDVITAHDGNEALSIVVKNDKICAMLLDLNMPNVDGFAVLEYFRNANLFNKIPVSIITGIGNENVLSRAYQYPIRGLLRKPFNERDIKKIVEEMLKATV